MRVLNNANKTFHPRIFGLESICHKNYECIVGCMSIGKAMRIDS